MVEIKDKINETIVESLKEAHRIEMAIRRLEPVERNLLRSRYIEGRSWEEICVEMCYSWRNIHNIHSRALIKLKECTQLHT
jgi:RNA polymerase sigma factor (sigma-70 family)